VRATTAALVTAFGLAVVSPPAGAYLDRIGPDWRTAAASDMAVVARLTGVERTEIEGWLYFAGELIVEEVVFGSASVGDTLELMWDRRAPHGPNGWGPIPSPDLRPYHENYAAISDVFPGVRVLWFLAQQEDGPVRADSCASLVSLSSPMKMADALRALGGYSGPADDRHKVNAVAAFLERELTEAGWPTGTRRAAQRSN
jgi:hypothetical protein